MWGRRVRERARVVGMWRALRAGVWFLVSIGVFDCFGLGRGLG